VERILMLNLRISDFTKLSANTHKESVKMLTTKISHFLKEMLIFQVPAKKKVCSSYPYI